MRTLIYAMPSSGASLFACFLAQIPDSIGIIDLWSVAPALTTSLPVVIKATINCEITFDDHCRGFRPDLRILFLRDPRDNWRSLDAKHYKDIRGTILEKLAILERVFTRRAELFDMVVRYEDFVRDPGGLAASLREHGLDLPGDALQLARGPQQIADFATRNSEWCRRQYLKHYGFGNLHFMDWGKLKKIHFPPPPEDVIAAISATCPQVEEHYAALQPVSAQTSPE